ncbi:MAG: asparagine synthase (glutamine-hydrolyzing) [Desulfobacteraceae bacterium]|jgi:asparagine synthase (glutamine-hydrolysing)
MCGIAGKVSFTSKSVSETDINKMTAAIIHRGPDDGGVYISPDQKVGLGNRRLAIIDLSPKGHMPMSYKDRYWITYNGEIYNFQVERKKLSKMGYRFKSQSDTEVIMALYDKYGVKCLDHLRGMFAFVIYDTQKNILFCARDRLGKKPFKYYIDANVFIFASELKAILTQSQYHPQPDYHAIHNYLTLQYCPSPQTGFIGINKLEPGHYILLDIAKNKLTKVRYWRLDFSSKIDLSEDEWQRRILSKLEESVKLRLISDVPLGAFLSGGIDSSAIVAMMAKNSSQSVKTFSIGFDEPKYNELSYARLVAQRFDTDHTEFIVKPETIEILPELVAQFEEPFADSSALATYYVSKLTRQQVTVALNGDGGDENFAGYGRYSVQKFSLWYDRIQKFNNFIIEPSLRLLQNHYSNTFLKRVLRFSQTVSQGYEKRYVNYICYFNDQQKRQLYTPDFYNRVGNNDSGNYISDKFQDSETFDKMDQTLYTDINTYLPDDLLVKVDIASMSVSLEGRSPFLDHEFMELMAKMPFNLKLRGQNTKKYILKQALKDFLPDKILNRPKMGFGVPLDKWFKGDLNSYLKGVLLSRRSINRHLFSSTYTRSLIESNPMDTITSYELWALLTLELWFRRYFDK